MRDKKAKGKPRRNPRGLNLQSSPQQQHMANYLNGLKFLNYGRLNTNHKLQNLYIIYTSTI